MEMWDIYDENKKRTGRTMKKNDWCLKRRRVSPDRAWHRSAHRRQVSDHEAGYDKGVGARLVGGLRRGLSGRRDFKRSGAQGSPRGDRA